MTAFLTARNSPVTKAFLPLQILSSLDDLATALDAAHTVVFDFETSSLSPHSAKTAGVGFFFPATSVAVYINTGHSYRDTQHPLYRDADLAALLTPWFSVPTHHAVAHNATYDIRMLYRIGVYPRCRISCSLIHTHRAYENYRSSAREPTTHPHLPYVNYGLKELMIGLFATKPTSLNEAANQKSPLLAPVRPVARYCIWDCVKTWMIFSRAQRLLRADTTLNALVNEIDDPNNLVVAQMMWHGVQVDLAEVQRQHDLYIQKIQHCRCEIWRLTNTRRPLDTPQQALKILRDLNATDDLGYDPFYADGGSVGEGFRNDVLETWYHECKDSTKATILGLFLSKNMMQQRINAFLRLMPSKTELGGRLYFRRFASTVATTRFSCNPNMQNLPGRADSLDSTDGWRASLPATCKETMVTRNIFVAKKGFVLVSADLSSAEPRYLAMACQQVLEDRGQMLSHERKALRLRRESKWPDLFKRMYETRKKYRGHKEARLLWPDLTVDPLFRLYRDNLHGGDVYRALMDSIDPVQYRSIQHDDTKKKELKRLRGNAKLAFLAITFGIQPESLAPQLGWSLTRTQSALASILRDYPTLSVLQDYAKLQMLHLGMVRSLTGRPRRINGFFDVCQSLVPLRICFWRKTSGAYRTYLADVIVMGTMAWGIQVFVERCLLLDEGYLDSSTIQGRLILAGNIHTGECTHQHRANPFVKADHFNCVPFRNVPYNQLQWVEESNGYRHVFPRIERGARQAFNAISQTTGADHLRWLMNEVSEKILCGDVADCQMVLTVHDSLVFEVPTQKVDIFCHRLQRIMTTRPKWASIDFAAEIEVGVSFGEQTRWSPPPGQFSLVPISSPLLHTLPLVKRFHTLLDYSSHY